METPRCREDDICECESHRDCTEGLDGVCVRNNMSSGTPQPDVLRHQYGECETDADCTGGICVPAGALYNETAFCMPAGCRVDADYALGLAMRGLVDTPWTRPRVRRGT